MAYQPDYRWVVYTLEGIKYFGTHTNQDESIRRYKQGFPKGKSEKNIKNERRKYFQKILQNNFIRAYWTSKSNNYNINSGDKSLLGSQKENTLIYSPSESKYLLWVQKIKSMDATGKIIDFERKTFYSNLTMNKRTADDNFNFMKMWRLEKKYKDDFFTADFYENKYKNGINTGIHLKRIQGNEFFEWEKRTNNNSTSKIKIKNLDDRLIKKFINNKYYIFDKIEQIIILKDKAGVTFIELAKKEGYGILSLNNKKPIFYIKFNLKNQSTLLDTISNREQDIIRHYKKF